MRQMQKGAEADAPAAAGAVRAPTCPVCDPANAPGVIFRAHEPCHKALGDFRCVQEESAARACRHEVLAERVSEFIGKPHFRAVHPV